MVIKTMMYKRHRTSKSKKKKFITIPKLEFDDQSQDVILNTKTPIICKITNEESDLINNERFVISKIEGDIITIKNKRVKMIFNAVKNGMFQRCFRVCYCSTVHINQGITINKPYMIWEWERFSDKMKYVALTRSTNKKLIYIQ